MAIPNSYQPAQHAENCDCSVCWSKAEMAKPVPCPSTPCDQCRPASARPVRTLKMRLRPLRLQEKELAYLTDQQIEKLFATIHSYCRTPHVAMIAAICLATGARWGGAQALTPDKVRNQLVTFVNTKGKRVRSIPVALELEQQIHRHFKQHGQFSNCLNSFDNALAESRLPVPAGQSSHVLRHTFASHFVMSGGSILTLQKNLGHTTLAMTMRYTHLAPDHLQDAIKLGPVSDYTKLLGEGVAMHGVPA